MFVISAVQNVLIQAPIMTIMMMMSFLRHLVSYHIRKHVNTRAVH